MPNNDQWEDLTSGRGALSAVADGEWEDISGTKAEPLIPDATRQAHQALVNTPMRTSVLPEMVRKAGYALPAIGGALGAIASSPGVVTSAAGGALGGMAGETTRENIMHRMFPEDEPSPVSKEGLMQTGEVGALNMGTGLALGGLSRVGAPSTKSVGLARGIAHDVAKKYVGPRLADAILPEAEPIRTPGPFGEIGPSPFGGMTSTADVSNLPTAKLPPVLSESPTTTGRPAAIVMKGTKAASEAAEGVKGSLAKASGRLVLMPEEALSEKQMQSVAKTRASQHGMYHAAAMRPPGGGKVPMTALGTITPGYSEPNEITVFDDEGKPLGRIRSR